MNKHDHGQKWNEVFRKSRLKAFIALSEVLACIDATARTAQVLMKALTHKSLLPVAARALVPIFPSAPNFIASLFLFTPVWSCITTNKYPTKSPNTFSTTAHAVLHTLILTLPLGALGNASVHSTYHGTQPRGKVKTGVFECQNCRKRRTPDVRVHRIRVARESKVERADDTVAAMERPN
jgi:hypothetical protein